MKSKNNLDIINDDGSESDSENEESGSEDGQDTDDFSYQNFCILKKKIFQFIENNTAAKEKKKISALIKANKYKNK